MVITHPSHLPPFLFPLALSHSLSIIVLFVGFLPAGFLSIVLGAVFFVS